MSFRQKWWWASLLAKSIEELIKTDSWDKLPDTMVRLFPYVSDLKINRYTRDPGAWEGAYSKLTQELERQ